MGFSGVWKQKLIVQIWFWTGSIYLLNTYFRYLQSKLHHATRQKWQTLIKMCEIILGHPCAETQIDRLC